MTTHSTRDSADSLGGDRVPDSDGGDSSARSGGGSQFGAGLDTSAKTPEKPRRKRGRRAGAKRATSETEKPRGGEPEGGAARSRKDESAPDERGEAEAPARPKRKRRKKSQSARSAEADATAEGADAEAPSEDRARSTSAPSEGEAEERAERRPARRRRKRTTRSRSGEEPERPSRADDDERQADDDERAADSDSEATGEAKPKKRRSRRRRKSGAAKADDAQGESTDRGDDDRESAGRDDDDREESDDSSEAAGSRRRRGSRGGRRRKKRDGEPVGVEAIPGEDDDLEELPDDAVLVESGREGKRSRRRSSSREGRSSAKESSRTRSEPAPVEQVRDQVILVNAHDPEETRVAVVGDGQIQDFHMSVTRYDSYVNDIYRGRVVNLESAIGAAFVDFGQGRNGFLHASDVMAVYGEKGFKLEDLLTARLDDDEASEVGGADVSDDVDEDEEPRGRGKGRGKSRKKVKARGNHRPRRPRLPIESLLKKGQMTVCQITKDAIGDKGPTLTTYISIPGRYLVLMPSLARTGVSRKIDDEKERRRLKRILQGLDIPDGMGVIVRTAGTSKLKRDIKRDLDYLIAVWEDFSKRLKSGRNPLPLYQESDVAIRTMRDLFSERTEKVVVDDPEVYERVLEFTRELMPEHEDRIQLHEGAKPLFHTFGVEQDFEKIFSRRVELPAGGSIVFDQTEALVAIDVNSGRTREDGAEFEDIALKTNLEAVTEIARQIRLRDLGGIIVCDFIDMMRMSSRRAVEKALREALVTDRARSKLGRISQFGLLELTRQRLGPGLSKLLYDTCQRCRGTGRQRSAESKAQAILRRLGSALTQKGFSTVEVRAHPETVHYMEEHCKPQMAELAEKSGRELTTTGVPDQMEDSVLRYLRADGREVRPGGRRKR